MSGFLAKEVAQEKPERNKNISTPMSQISLKNETIA